ncbi:MAG: cysteine desulfurase family protein [Fibrobacterota bacterium]
MIYFDNAATTKPARAVLETHRKTAENFFGNPGSLHTLGIRSEALLKQCRQQIIALLQADSYRVIFTASATEANNIALFSLARKSAARGKHIISSTMEHPSVHETLKALEKEGFTITWLTPDAQGIISPENVQKALRSDTVLVTCMRINNEVGALSPTEDMAQTVRSHSSARFHCDAVQCIGKYPFSLKNSAMDTVSLSGHKFHGLKGAGALLIKGNLDLDPFIHGGNQEYSLRSGTPDVAAAAALAKALRLSMEECHKKVEKIQIIHDYLYGELEKMEEVVINSPRHGAPHILNFSIPKITAETVVHSLSQENIFISTVSACSAGDTSLSRPVWEITGDIHRARSSLRLSFSPENTPDEGRDFIQIFKRIIKGLL